MRAVGAILIITSLLVVGAAGRAEACSCAMLDPASMLENSDAAFIGTLVERPTEPNSPDDFNGIYVFEVEQWVKGDLGPQVGVHAALDGAGCGFEMSEGERAGIFLYNDNGRPSGGLCNTTSPAALLSANQALVFNGSGPPVFLIASDVGRARLATLDASGRLLAAVGDEGFGWSVSVCPQGDLVVEVVEGEVMVRDVATLEVSRVVEAPRVDGLEQAWCLDPSGERILARAWNEGGTDAHLLILGEDEPRYTGEIYHLDVTPDHVAIISGPASTFLELVSTTSGEIRRLADVTEVSHVSFSPDGNRLLVSEAHHGPQGGWDAHLTVFDVASGGVFWESGPLPDLEVYGWIDDHRVAAGFYPIEAERPQNVILDTEGGDTAEIPLEGIPLASVGGSIVSMEEGNLMMMSESGDVSLLAPLPSPGHRLVSLLDDSVDLRPPETTPTTLSDATSPPPTEVPEAGAEPAPGSPWPPVLGLVAAAMIVGAAALTRRRRRT